MYVLSDYFKAPEGWCVERHSSPGEKNVFALS